MSAAGGKDSTRELLDSYLQKTTSAAGSDRKKPTKYAAAASAAGGDRKPPTKDEYLNRDYENTALVNRYYDKKKPTSAAGGDRQWPFIRESIEKLVYGKNILDKRLKQNKIIMKNIMEKFMEKSKEKSKAPTYDDIKENRQNRLFSIEHIDPEVGKILESLTKIPFDDRDILEKIAAKQKEIEDALRKKKTKDAIKLSKACQRELLIRTVELEKREEQRSQNPLYFFLSVISEKHKDGPSQITELIKIVSEEIKESILKWYEKLNPALQMDEEEKKEVENIDRALVNARDEIVIARREIDNLPTKWYKRCTCYKRCLCNPLAALTKTLGLIYIFLKMMYTFMSKIALEKFPNLSLGVITGLINPKYGAVAGLSSYFLNGDQDMGLTTTKGLLNTAGSLSLIYSSYKGLCFVLTSNTRSWVMRTLRNMGGWLQSPEIPSAVDAMSIFSHFGAFIAAVSRDIEKFIPNLEDIFAVRLYREKYGIVTTFQIACQIIQDMNEAETETQQVQIMNYLWRAGFYSYNLTAALSDPYHSFLVNFGAKPNATFTEFIKITTVDAFKYTVKETATSFAEDLESNPEIQQKLEDKVIAAIGPILAKKSPEFMAETVKMIKQKIEEEMPDIIEKFPDFVQRVTEVLAKNEKFIEGMLGHTQELADTIVASVATSFYNASVPKDVQKMLPPVNKLDTSEKLAKAATSLVVMGLEHLKDNPEIVENAVEAVAPIIEEGVTIAVSRGFGKAEAEGYTNTVMLGVIKGAIGVGAEKAQSSMLEQVGYIAGTAGRQVPGVVVNAATGLAEDVYKGGQIIVDAAGNIVDATMAMHYGLNPQTDYDKFVPPQSGTQIPVPPGRFKNKKSTSKSLYKKKNVKSPKSIKNNRKKKSPLRKKKSLLKRKL